MNCKTKQSKWLFALLGVLTLISACARPPKLPEASPVPATPTGPQISIPPQTPQAVREVSAEARVESISIAVTKSLPAQVTVVAKGMLPDSCTRIGDITQSRQGNQFIVAITAVRPAEAFCAQALVPFEEKIPLNVAGLQAGEYVVTVNGISDAFKLEAEPALPAVSAPSEVVIRDADVSEVELQVLESFPVQVKAVVKGYLRDGCTKIASVEQNIDIASKTIRIVIKTARPADMMCIQVIVPYEETIPLSVYGLAAGNYTVDVNGVTRSFRLERDNLPDKGAASGELPEGWRWAILSEGRLSVAVPADWVQAGAEWASPSGDRKLGVRWAKIGADWTPQDMLPKGASASIRLAPDLGALSGIFYVVSQREAAEYHLIAPAESGIAYDFYASAPSEAALKATEDIYLQMVRSALVDDLVSEAAVQSIELRSSSSPDQVEATVRGQLRDSCVKITRAVQRRDGEIIRITLLTARLAAPHCTNQPQPFEYSFPLEVEGLPQGTYILSIGAIAVPFNFPSPAQ